MQWYYSKHGTQLGPVEQPVLLAKIATGEVTPGDLVWRDGLAAWVACGLLHELRAQAGGGPPPPPPPPPPPGAAPVFPYAPPAAMEGSGSYVPPPASNGKATASMVLGIISTVFATAFAFWCCISPIVAVPCGILAIVFGNQVKQAATLDPSLLGELGKAKAGIITGWIGVGLSIAMTAGVAVFIGIFGKLQ